MTGDPLRTVEAESTEPPRPVTGRRQRDKAPAEGDGEPPRPGPWWWRSISGRIVSVVLGLLLVVQALSFGALRESLSRHARAALPEQLRAADRVLQSLLEQRAQKLAESARLLAADYGFREAVSSGDGETIASALENHGARIGATEVALFGTGFALRAMHGVDRPAVQALASRLSGEVTRRNEASEIAVLGGQPHLIVLVPVKAPVVVGWVLMGLPLEGRLTAELRSLSARDLTLFVRGAGGGSRWQAALSSLPADRAGALAAAWGDTAMPATPQVTSLTAGGEELGVHVRPLGTGQVLGLVSTSVDEAVRLPSDLQAALLAITLLGFIAFGIGSLLTARRMATPLRRLAAAAERLRRGDYRTPVSGVRRGDEIGELATAFEQMRVSVADKQAEVMRLAYWDPLTGLPNRLQFRDAVRATIQRAEANATFAVLMLDLDRFKHVNDALGYRFGDLLLTRVAERLLQNCVREGDIVARLGGDEFAVMLGDAEADAALAVARRIEQAFDRPLMLEDHTVDMRAGIGIACWPGHAQDADVLLSRAEVAMYTAKRRGSGAMVYSPSIDAASAQTLSLLTDLRRAVEEGHLRLYLQPKIALASASVVGAEALLRWQHPVRGLVPPMEFVPFAEQTGYIRTLTLWVFAEAVRLQQRLRGEQLAITLSINLSTRDLLDPELPQKFGAVLASHGIPASSLCLEITESAIMDDPQRAQATLERLAAIGFKLAIDDFGSGYSSLAYLKRLPVDELKIDKSFVMAMEHDADDAKIVRSTIDLAHNLGLSVVAEGVESAVAWDMLRELRCDEAQGFHMGRPMPAPEFAGWSVAWGAQKRPAAAHGKVLLH